MKDCSHAPQPAERGEIEVRLRNNLAALPIKELIDQVEASLGTAVQTAVKRRR